MFMCASESGLQCANFHHHTTPRGGDRMACVLSRCRGRAYTYYGFVALCGWMVDAASMNICLYRQHRQTCLGIDAICFCCGGVLYLLEQIMYLAAFTVEFAMFGKFSRFWWFLVHHIYHGSARVLQQRKRDERGAGRGGGDGVPPS